MAHSCIYCGSECYCSGDIDDVIVSKTPNKCEGCGCKQFAEDQGWDEDDWDDEDDYDVPSSKYTDDGGIIDSDDPDIIHYPATKQ